MSANSYSRRDFLKTAALVTGAWGIPYSLTAETMSATELPCGKAPAPVPLTHFPDRLHAFVWRNWQLVPLARLAAVVGAKPADILCMGRAMGLSKPPSISKDQLRRSYLTIIRRNWHLLPYEQLLQLLDWKAEQLAYTLREDDFFYEKLGSLKPQCPPLKFTPPDATTLQREQEMAAIIRETFPAGVGETKDPLFGFVERLSKPPAQPPAATPNTDSGPRFCYSYFALYGDPLLDEETNPYPDGYLAQLASAGVNGVWLQAVLNKLAPFPWDNGVSTHWKERLRNLRALVKRARRYGIGIYLYLNEPRSMPLKWFESRPDLKGVVENDHAALCTSNRDVQEWLTSAIARICQTVPDLAGFFTITASENLTNCWSHRRGKKCPRCSTRQPADVIAEVHSLIHAGIRQAGSQTQLLAWDWGWADEWSEAIIQRLPAAAALMSVSEWSLPIQRGGIAATIGEYSISAIGPGPRAPRHWNWARQRGMKTIAKIQAGNTWELSAVPYIPAVENVARHAANLREAQVDGLMLGWTLGGYPSPNLEVVAEINRHKMTPVEAMQAVAMRRFGARLAPAVVQAWRDFSTAFAEFPFHISVVYRAPMQYGPANLLWAKPTGYSSSMTGFPYDDLDGWRAIYPPDVFIGQFEKIADGFESSLKKLKAAGQTATLTADLAESQALALECNVAEAAAIHFRSTANQARFILTRHTLEKAKAADKTDYLFQTMETLLKNEIEQARRLHAIQIRDSRMGFEASNHYFYVPLDLAEKVLNCRELLEHWLPEQRLRYASLGK